MAPPIPNPAPVPSNVTRPSTSSIPTTTAATSTITESHPQTSHIKAEPGTQADIYTLPPANGISHHAGPEALQRASQNLAERFPDAAKSQVAQLQARSAALANQPTGLSQQRPPQPSQQQQQQRPPLHPILTEDQRRAVQDQQRMMYAQQHRQAQAVQGGAGLTPQQQQQRYQQQMHAQAQAQAQAQQRAAASVQQSQTDGASDWAAMVASRRAEAADGTGRERADYEIRQRVERMAKEMEGGGLMLPISEVQANAKKASTANAKKRKASHPLSSSSPSNPTPSTSSAPSIPPFSTAIPQTDGPASDTYIKDEDVDTPDTATEDADAINSDLDDPDDNVVDGEEEDGSVGQIMLCTYDKVQRVKNKWKCTLKDGVLTTGGRE